MRALVLLVCLFAIVPAASAAAPLRQWTDKSGKFQVEARLISATMEGVTLQKADGSRVTVKIEQLSRDDQ